MLFRAIALSLALMLSMGTIITLTTNYSEAGPRHYKKNKKKKLKKYSKAWWKWYRAKKRRQKALAARKRALRLRQIRLARQKRLGVVPVAKSNTTKQPKAGSTRDRVASDNSPAMLPTGETAPNGWKRNQTPNGELQYNVDDESGKNIGSVSLADVGPANNADSGRKTLGGVQTSALRRTVIDRMMRQQGWVVNDFQKEVGGKKVYVVVAQSQGANGRVQTHTFYFTEANGRIYSLAANSEDSSTERIASESEKVINSLQRNARPTQQADLR